MFIIWQRCGGLLHIASNIGREAGHNLDSLPGHHRAILPKTKHALCHIKAQEGSISRGTVLNLTSQKKKAALEYLNKLND